MPNKFTIPKSLEGIAGRLLRLFQPPRLVPGDDLKHFGEEMKTAASSVKSEGQLLVRAYHAGEVDISVHPQDIIAREKFGRTGDLTILDLQKPESENLNLARWVSEESPHYGHSISVEVNMLSRGKERKELDAPWKTYFNDTGILPIFLFVPMSCGSPRLFLKSDAVGEGFSATVDPTPKALLDFLRKHKGLSSALEENSKRPVVIAGNERTARMSEKFVTMLKEFREPYKNNPFFLAQSGSFPKFNSYGRAILEVPAEWDMELRRVIYPFQPLQQVSF